MLAQVFGDMLYYPETDLLTEFPTPESVKGRILISTKPPSKEYLQSKQFKDSDSERESTEELSPCVISELEAAAADEKVSLKTDSFLVGFTFISSGCLCHLFPLQPDSPMEMMLMRKA